MRSTWPGGGSGPYPRVLFPSKEDEEKEEEEVAENFFSPLFLCSRSSHVENWTLFYKPFLPAFSLVPYSAPGLVRQWIQSAPCLVRQGIHFCIKISWSVCGVSGFWVHQEVSIFSTMLGSSSDTVHTSVCGVPGRISISCYVKVDSGFWGRFSEEYGKFCVDSQMTSGKCFSRARVSPLGRLLNFTQFPHEGGLSHFVPLCLAVTSR